MKRGTCLICRKKRYIKNMRKAHIYNIQSLFEFISDHWVCVGSCYDDYLKRLSGQVGQIEKLIVKMSTRVDNKS